MRYTASTEDGRGVPDIDIVHAMVRATVSPPNTTFNANHTCSSGNCTWDPYYTLAVRSECIDLTDRIEMQTPCSPLGNHSYDCAAFCASHHDAATVYSVAKLSPDISHELSAGISCQEGLRSIQSDLTNTTLLPFSQSLAFAGRGGILVDFVRWDEGEPRTENFTMSLPVVVTECSLRVVAQKLTASSINDVFAEVALGAPLENNSHAAVHATMWRPDGPAPDPFDGPVTPNNTQVELITIADGDGVVAAYRMGNTPLGAISELGRAVFGYAADVYHGYPNSANADFWTLLGPIFDGSEEQEDLGRAQKLVQSLSDTLDNVARALTAMLRDYIGPMNATVARAQHALNPELTNNMSIFEGTAEAVATTNIPTFHIQWLWMILPVALVVCLGILILLTALHVHAHELPAWGNGTFEAMLHGMDDETRHALLACTDREALEMMSRSVEVQIVANSNTLVAVGDHRSRPVVEDKDTVGVVLEELRPSLRGHSGQASSMTLLHIDDRRRTSVSPVSYERLPYS